MIPLTPMFVVAAAQAMARHARLVERGTTSTPCALEFVRMVGESAHYDAKEDRANWPLAEATSIAALRSAARRYRWERTRPEMGDLLLFPTKDDGDMRDGAVTVGIVLAALEHTQADGDWRTYCMVAWAEAEGRHGMRIEQALRVCERGSRHEAIRWYAYYDDLEKAA